MSTGRQVPLARPDIGPRERELVNEVLENGPLALGPRAVEFEQRLAERAGRAYGVSCSSGTAGLHMIVRSLGIRDGDEVLTTPFSFVASANCLLYERARPRFVDIEEDSLGLDPGQLAAAATPRTVGVLAVHVFGRPCAIGPISAISEQRGWHLIEDSCEALGSEQAGRPMGSFGAASAFAFYPNKQITTGEGGMVVTDDHEMAEDMRSLRNQGRDRDGTWLNHVQLGFNYRMDELSAALGVAQLERLEELRAGRARVAAAYARALAGVDAISLPTAGADERVDWFVHVVRLHPDIDRTQVMADLADGGVPSRPYFSPLHLQPLYRKELGHGPGDFPVTERIAATTLALPWSSNLSDDEVDYVAEVLIGAIRRQSGA